jgi:hypothetical protein
LTSGSPPNAPTDQLARTRYLNEAGGQAALRRVLLTFRDL